MIGRFFIPVSVSFYFMVVRGGMRPDCEFITVNLSLITCFCIYSRIPRAA